MDKEISVYLFCGFLGAGKTKFIDGSLADAKFNEGEKTLVILCEQGEEELTPEEFASPEVTLEVIDSEQLLTPDRLEARRARCGAERVMIEYNGMWQLGSLYNALPDNWVISQQVYLCDAGTIMVYNGNMRALVAQNIQNADMVIFNRVEKGQDTEPLHKLVRSLSRSVDIIYEYPDGSAHYDDTVDPLPFDTEAAVVEISDRDYAIWYRDMMEDMPKYNGKTVRFTAVVAKNSQLPKGTIAAGRHVMTCCVQDITYEAVIAVTPDAESFKSGEWAVVEGRISIEKNKVYNKPGPVIYASSVTRCAAPEEKVATFY